MKLNYRSQRFTPTVRVIGRTARDETLRALRQTLEAESARLAGTRGHLLRLALNEAEALAMQTAHPVLVFPELAREKLQALAAWHTRQVRLRPGEPALAFAA